MDRPIVALVLAGGTGTRLYPASRSDRPKQFLSFGLDDGTAGDDAGGASGVLGEDPDASLLARTVDRVSFADRTVVLTADRFADRVREHAPGTEVLVEPAPKDTGPALVYAAARVREAIGECVLLCVPSDHSVDGDFETPARRATGVAVETGGLVTLGVEPTRPATGYGYVQPGDWRPAPASDGQYAPVERFTEKPDAAAAEELLAAGCLWNAGIFAWTPDALLSAARETPLAPLAAAALDGEGQTGRSIGERSDRRDAEGDDRTLETAFEAVDPVSVDYAIMERAEDAYVVALSADWDDLGAWDALARVLDTDADGNAIVGDALTVDAADNVIASDGAHVSVVGASDLVVVAVGDRVLVVPGDRAQRVREVVAALRQQGRF